MRLILLFAFLFCLPVLLSAQLGVQLSANFNKPGTVFLTGVGEFEFPEYNTGGELAVNYWFRLPKQRIAFLPTLYYSTARADVEAANNKFQELGFQLKTNIYPFDFLGDCDCPTFGKQGPQLQKGLFLQLSGGYAAYRTNISVANIDFTDNQHGFTFGGGIGMDIGVSKLVTITPIASVRIGTQAYQELQISDGNGPPIGTGGPKLTTFQLGILTSFRFDHKRY
jgi:hypothetical protein